jgi:segregation and condensation protein A
VSEDGQVVRDQRVGPLDWLVEMARARRIDLARLSILALVDAFAAAMAAALARHGTDGAAFDLAGWADWTVLAAQLAELRSRLLLPADTPAGRRAQADAEALRRRLLSRAETGAVADWLERRHQLGREVFAGGCRDRGIGALLGAGQEDRAVPPRAGDRDVAELLRACLVALRVPEDARPERTRWPPLWTTAQATAHAAADRGDGGGECTGSVPAEDQGRRAGPRAALQGGARQHPPGRAGAGP